MDTTGGIDQFQNKQLESLKAGRDSARQRIVSLLEKIENIGI